MMRVALPTQLKDLFLNPNNLTDKMANYPHDVWIISHFCLLIRLKIARYFSGQMFQASV